MKTIKNSLPSFLIYFSLMLGGCAIQQDRFFVQSDSSDAAIIQGTHEVGWTSLESYSLGAIDGKVINYGTSRAKQIVKVTPGIRVLVIEATMGERWPRNFTRDAYITLEMNIIQYQKYKITGTILKNEIQVWLADPQTNERLSPIVTEPLGKAR